MDQLEQKLQDVGIEYRPELRWWLAAGYHTDETLRWEIETAYKMGFGGMEFLAMDEDGIDNQRYAWGSEEWVHDSKIVVEETTKRGMSVSFTSGTNWSNANLPDISPEHPAAAKELNYVYEDLSAGQKRSGALPRIDLKAMHEKPSLFRHKARVTEQTFFGVVAAKVLGEKDEVVTLDKETVDLTTEVKDESLEWSAPEEGKWRLFVFWQHGTGQIAEPSASVNYTVNYLDKEGAQAVIDYWRNTVLTPELTAIIAKNPRAQMYMDSLELVTAGAGGLFWGHSVADEFQKRRGYSLMPYLPFLIRDVMIMAVTATFPYDPPAGSKQMIDKVRFDLVKTYTDLYMENMLRPFGEFLRQNGITLRAEISYGLPFELTRPGPEVDGIETESLEFGSQIDGYRLMAGVAHLFGKQYSSETGANTRNFMLSHMFYDQIINTQLCAGITKTVLHGWASMAGAPGTKWPGHEGMFPIYSERFDTRQPGSEFYHLWSQSLGRKQYLLRQGRPRIDVGILRTDHATDNFAGAVFRDENGYQVADEVVYGTWYMRNRQNHWWQDLSMQDSGYTYEFFDGELLLRPEVNFDGKLVQPDGPGYQALIVYQSTIVRFQPCLLASSNRSLTLSQNFEVAQRLLEWAKKGLKVLVVHNTRELLYMGKKLYATYPRAAAATQGLDGRDDHLASILKELFASPTVTEVHQPSETVRQLRQLGVHGRAEFKGENRNILTHLRDDGHKSFLFVYHFLYETGKPTTVELTIDGEGAVYRVDPDCPTVRPVSAKASAGRTKVALHLSPGETALLILDKKEPARTIQQAKVKTVEVSDWNLVVESWGAGEIEEIKEDRGKGYETVEHRPHVKKTLIEVGPTPLVPWQKMEMVGKEHSGIGIYTSTFDLPSSFDESKATRAVLDLGSTSGGLGSVIINGSTPLGYDTAVPRVDATGHVRRGTNEVTVRVASSLNNRLLADGYYKRPGRKSVVVGEWPPGDDGMRIRDYGLVGPVTLSYEV